VVIAPQLIVRESSGGGLPRGPVKQA
jgi:hypothetical protein